MLFRSIGKYLVRSSLDSHSRQFPRSFVKACDIYLAQNDALANLFEGGPATLIHGDLHLGNLYRDASGGVGAFDWALAARMPGMWDVSYVLCNSFPPEFRRQYQRTLLARYARALVLAGGPARSEAEIWDEYRCYAFYPWISATATLGAGDRMQPTEIAARAVDWKIGRAHV